MPLLPRRFAAAPSKRGPLKRFALSGTSRAEVAARPSAGPGSRRRAALDTWPPHRAMSSTLAAWVTPPGRLAAATPLWEGAKECAACGGVKKTHGPACVGEREALQKPPPSELHPRIWTPKMMFILRGVCDQWKDREDGCMERSCVSARRS